MKTHLLFGKPHSLMKQDFVVVAAAAVAISFKSILPVERAIYARSSSELIAHLCFNAVVHKAKWRILKDKVQQQQQKPSRGSAELT